MGFLKKSSAPSELPNLAIDSLGVSAAKEDIQPTVQVPVNVAQPIGQPIVAPASVVPKKLVGGEDYLEVSHDEAVKTVHEDINKIVDENTCSSRNNLDGFNNDKIKRMSFFDEVLKDINSGIKDVGKLEDWYEKKFVGEDVVSNMKGYWEGNKADIIIESFGAEYKRQINDKVKVLRELEEDWREIYFRLVKKEEEMKKEERELKETLSEFVNLCKERKHGNEK